MSSKPDIHPVEKAVVEHEEEYDIQKATHHAALKSDYDRLSSWETVKSFKKAVLVCSLMCIAAAADGYQYTLNGNVIANSGFIRQIGFQNAAGTYVLNANHTALWGAMQSLGQLIGMVFINPISDRIGRKMTLYVLWLFLFASVLIESLVKNWKEWAAAKILAGIGIGAIQSTLPVYVAEWSPVNIRGIMVVAYGVWNYVGCFLAPVVLYVVQKRDVSEWRLSVYTQWAFVGIMLPIFIWLPETASYYAARGLDEQGVKTLHRVNGRVKGYDANVEYAVVKNIILEERRLVDGDEQDWRAILRSYVDCFRRDHWKRTVAGSLGLLTQQLTGLSFLSTYSSLFFRQSGFTNPFQVTTITYAIKLVNVLVVTLSTDKIGRRNPTMLFASLCSVSLLIIGVLGQMEKTLAVKNGLVALACFWAVGNSGIGALGYSFLGEVASQKLRARSAGLSAGIPVLFGLTFNTTVPYMLDVNKANWGYNTAWLFFGTSVLILVVDFFLLPEPARRNAAEMDELYSKKIPAWKMKGYETDVQKDQKARLQSQGF